MPLQHLRSSTANKRPLPGSMSDGQLAVNTNLASPGLFFKDSNGALVKVGPAHVGTTAPNVSPAVGGQTGNSAGELWLDTTGGDYTLKTWDGTAWREIVVTSAMIKNGTIVDADVNASAAIAGTKISPNFGSQAVTTTGTITGASLIPTSSTAPTNGLYLPTANGLGFATGGSMAMLLDSSNRLVKGHTASINAVNNGGSTITPAIQQHGADQGNATFAATNWQDSSTPAFLVLGKSRGGTVNTHGVVSANSTIGFVNYIASDGTTFGSAAWIGCHADVTTAAGSTPGRLTFATSATGSTSPTERMRIRSDGNIGIGGSGSNVVTLYNHGATTGGTNAYANFTNTTIQSDVTGTAFGYSVTANTVAAAFTLANLHYYSASQGTIGASSSITNQYGFIANSTLIGATNNYGFYGNIPSGTGRWNFYANGTAANYFNGDTGIGTTSITEKLTVSGNVAANAFIPTSATVPTNGIYLPAANTVGIATDGASRFQIDATGVLSATGTRYLFGTNTVINDGTSAVGRFQIAAAGANNSRVFTQFHYGQIPVFRQAISASTTLGVHSSVSGSSTLGVHDWYGSDGTNFIAGGSITCAVDGTPATGSMPGRLVFSTTPSGSGTAVERMRIRSDGNIAIGGSGSGSVTLYNQGSITGFTTAYGNFTNATVQSDVTANAYGYRTTLTTAAAAFNLVYLHHYNATQAASFGAGSTVSNQFGFIADSTLTGAGNNYGFYGNIPSGTGRWNFYANGTAANYFASGVRLGGTATANELDVYEEGTFTPTVVGTTVAGTGTYATNGQVGRYTRTGNRVFFDIYLEWTAHTGTGNLQINGLPFTVQNTTNSNKTYSAVFNNITLTAGAQGAAFSAPNTTTVLLRQTPGGGGAVATVAMDTAGSVSISGCFEVA